MKSTPIFLADSKLKIQEESLIEKKKIVGIRSTLSEKIADGYTSYC